MPEQIIRSLRLNNSEACRENTMFTTPLDGLLVDLRRRPTPSDAEHPPSGVSRR